MSPTPTRRAALRSLAALGIAAALPVAALAAPPADLVLLNGSVHTMAAARTVVQAVAIRKGRIVFVGGDTDARAHVGPQTKVIDLQGKMVLPGFHDMHVHPEFGGEASLQFDLDGAKTLAQALEMVRRYAREHPTKSWIIGSRWPAPLRNENPTRQMLDAIVPDRPVCLLESSGHAVWANSKALAAAKITAKTPDPKGGIIRRDPKTGEPTGILEESAMFLVWGIRPVSPEDQRRWIAYGIRQAIQNGITAIQDANVDLGRLEAYRRMERSGELSVRVRAAIGSGLRDFEKLRKKYRGRLLDPGTIKIYADSALEGHTAALLEPYSDVVPGSQNDRGIAIHTPDALNAFVVKWDKAGFQMHIHVAGDRGTRMSLDALEAARRANGVRDSRHHIAHLELVHPQDIPRFRALGVAANVQGFWAHPNPVVNDIYLPELGAERARWLYPIGSLARTGALLVGGSDWPVSTINPLEAIQVAITRRDPALGEGPAWIPEERVDLPTMLAAYTINAAYVNFLDKETGSLEVGKAADLIVLGKDLFDVPPHQIGKVKVLLTLLEGKETWRAPDFPKTR